MTYSQIQHSLKITAVILTLTTIILITTIALGLFDPKPVGELAWKLPLSSLTIPAHQQQIMWLDEPLPKQDYSIRLTAAFVEGEKDSLYGLILGNNNENIAILLSPLGYATIQQSALSSQPSAVFPFQSWPHVRTGDAPNEIWIDVIDQQFEIRINGELFWVGEVGTLREGFVGFMGESWGETAVYNFQQLDLYQ